MIVIGKKDEAYSEYFSNTMQRGVNGILPPQVSLTIVPEMKLLARMLYYYLLMMRSGGQTLGEEFTDIIQAKRTLRTMTPRGKMPGVQSPIFRVSALASRRQKLVFFAAATFLPYLKDRIDAGKQGWNELVSLLFKRKKMTAHERARLLRQRFQQRQTGQQDEKQGLFSRMKAFVRKISLTTIRKLGGFFEVVNRLHLLMFFLYGRYYSVFHRLAKIRYIDSKSLSTISAVPERGEGQPVQQNLSYRVIGLFLFVELLASSIFWLQTESQLPNIVSFIRPILSRFLPISAFSNSTYLQGPGGAGNLIPTLNDLGPTVKQAIVGRQGSHCGICFAEPIESPACGPCGHLYCFPCILGSSLAKRMCPICRQPVKPQQVQCVYFSNTLPFLGKLTLNNLSKTA